MSTITSYTPILDGTGATPSVFNSRLSLLQENIETLNVNKLETVGTDDIDNLSVTANKLAANAVTTSKILDDAVTGDKIYDSSVATVAKLRVTGDLTAATLDATTGQETARIYDPINGHRFELKVDSTGNLNLSHYIGGSSYNYTLINTRRRLLLVGSGEGSTAPAGGLAPGATGEVAFDDDYMYLCTSNSSWRRVAISEY